MNLDTALEFLRRHQPMPSDAELTSEDALKLAECADVARATKDERFIALLIGAFGMGTGHGVYETVVGTLVTFDRDNLIPVVANGLNCGVRSVEYWCCDIAGELCDSTIVDALIDKTLEPSSEVRERAVASLWVLSKTVARAKTRVCEMEWNGVLSAQERQHLDLLRRQFG